MKLKNKKTGQEGNFIINKDHFECVDLDYVPEYRNLTELNEEWEDVPEPKGYWFIDTTEGTDVNHTQEMFELTDKERKQIGNYFDTREEAEKAVEKLKAWKRLKDKGFRFDGYDPYFEGFWAIFPNDTEGTWCLAEDKADLDLLFGGEDCES